jgi:hypothetical protein
MRRIGWLVLLVLVPALAAQNPRRDPGRGPGQAQWLRQQVLARWRARVRTELQLTGDQAAKLQATEDHFFARRRDVAERQRFVVQGLREQLQPGVAANPDSVRRLMDARDQNRAEVAQIEQDEDKEIAGYLSPVQHARYQLMRQRFQERIAEMQRERRERMLGPGNRQQP